MSRLIIVEESRTIQRMVEISLKGLGLNLHPVYTLEELSELNDIELLICSALGSWGDESALISQLNVRGISAPVVMLTPHGRPPEGFLGGHVIAALQKPFHTQTLVRAVCLALDREAPDEELFAPLSSIPLKRGGHSALSEPVTPASLKQAAPPRSAPPASPEAERGLIPPPAQPPQQMSFQTVVGVPILSEPILEAPAEPEEQPAAEAPLYEPSTSFGFVPNPPEPPQATLRGGPRQGLEEPSFEPSTSFGFDPSSLEGAQYGPPPVFDEPPSVSAQEAPSSTVDELEDLDDSFSALDHAELDVSPDWEEDEEPSDEEPNEAAELSQAEGEAEAYLNLERFAQSSSPVLNSAVTEVLKVTVLSLKEAGIHQATSEEALELLSQVAWEVIPELAEQIVRHEIEQALAGEGGA